MSKSGYLYYIALKQDKNIKFMSYERGDIIKTYYKAYSKESNKKTSWEQSKERVKQEANSWNEGYTIDTRTQTTFNAI